MFLWRHIRRAGNKCSHEKLLEAAMEKIIIDSIENGKKTIFAPQIAFNPVTAATVAGIKNKSNSKIIEILLKYIIFKLLAKYLKQKAEKARKSTIYKNATTYFKNLPPKNSETSRISLLIKGFKNLHTSNINSKQIIVRYNMFSQAPVEVNFRIIVGIFSIILLLMTVINNAYISNLPIFSIVLIFYINPFHV